MAQDSPDTGINAAGAADGASRIFIFKSEARADLRAFAGDLAGTRLPSQFRPWHATGAIAPEQDPPYKFSREAIQLAIDDRGFQLWRLVTKSS